MGRKVLKPEICAQLYEKYVQSDQTPEHLVSSHWREMHQTMSAGDGKNIDAIKGVGFGEMDRLGPVRKLLSWATICVYMVLLSNRTELFRLITTGRKVAKRMGLDFSYDCFRQLCTLDLIHDHTSPKKDFTCLVIGDGYGFLSCVIKEVLPDAHVVLVDLGKTLFFQARGCQRAFPSAQHFLVGLDNDCRIEDADFVYCPAESINILKPLIKVYWAINVASMQEMNSVTVAGYFEFLRGVLEPENLFYCCNREEKQMPDGEISRFFDYPWSINDEHMIEGECPWHRFFLSVGRTKHGPKLIGFRLPFISYFDGLHLHRLSRLSVNKT